jgi:hypothetical protein
MEAKDLLVHPCTAVAFAQAVRSLEQRLLAPMTPSILFFGQQECPSSPATLLPASNASFSAIVHCPPFQHRAQLPTYPELKT